MATGKIKVRNACPFSVTFYALAGPSMSVAPNSTQSAHACRIWFSTRVKGGGDTINQTTFERLAEAYREELEDYGNDANNWEEGGTGAALGSALGMAVGEFSAIFKVKNTKDGDTLYFGAKKEGVYGNSNLVVYATLDPACRLPQNPKRKWWWLHLETDHGQETSPDDTEPLYVKPDLSKYHDMMFFRIRNVANSGLLYVKDGTDINGIQTLGLRHIDVPFNPMEYPEYFSLHPTGEDNIHNIQILNVMNNKWMTVFTDYENTVGLYSVGQKDGQDQHWTIENLEQNPQTIKLNNINNIGVSGYLAGYTDDDRVFIYFNIDSADDQKWLVETFCVDVSDVPSGTEIRLMHAKTGKYISYYDSPYFDISVEPQIGVYGIYEFQNFTLNPCDGGYNLLDSSGKRLSYSRGDDRLIIGGDDEGSIWDIVTLDTKSGFYLKCRQGGPYGSSLYWNGERFGLYSVPSDDQIWVAQLA